MAATVSHFICGLFCSETIAVNHATFFVLIRTLALLLCIFSPRRNLCVARNRYRWFGRRDACILPNSDGSWPYGEGETVCLRKDPATRLDLHNRIAEPYGRFAPVGFNEHRGFLVRREEANKPSPTCRFLGAAHCRAILFLWCAGPVGLGRPLDPHDAQSGFKVHVDV
jgi:hypothetical protein